MNYIILFASAVVLKTKINPIRLLISSIVGATYAVVLYMNIFKAYSNVLLKIILSVVMVEIAFKPNKISVLLKDILIFYLISFTFGGAAFFLIYFLNSQNIFFSNGKLIGIYPIKTIFIGGLIGFLITTISFKLIKKRFTKEDMLAEVEIGINKKMAKAIAIVDTGNFLKDPISKAPVIVIEKQVLKNVVPDEILDNVQDIINGKNIPLDNIIDKIRLIPFTSLGKENGMLLGIKSDKTVIHYQEKDIFLKNSIIGIYTGALSKTGQYKALIGIDAIDEKGDNLDEYKSNRDIKI